MYTFVLLLVLAVALYLAGRPLVQPDPEEEALLLRAAQAVAGRERNRVLVALGEIENDHQTGKLSQADYEQLKSEYARKAVEFLKAEAPAAAGAPRHKQRGPASNRPTAPGRTASRDLDAEAEAEIALALAASAHRSGGEAPGHCTGCGAALLRPDQKFCHICGQAVEGRA
ncbi:MAG: hypothetical protein ACYC5Y_08240 [Symbiobacteriia bacterium]